MYNDFGVINKHCIGRKLHFAVSPELELIP